MILTHVQLYSHGLILQYLIPIFIFCNMYAKIIPLRVCWSPLTWSLYYIYTAVCSSCHTVAVHIFPLLPLDFSRFPRYAPLIYYFLLLEEHFLPLDSLQFIIFCYKKIIFIHIRKPWRRSRTLWSFHFRRSTFFFQIERGCGGERNSTIFCETLIVCVGFKCIIFFSIYALFAFDTKSLLAESTRSFMKPRDKHLCFICIWHWVASSRKYSFIHEALRWTLSSAFSTFELSHDSACLLEVPPTHGKR